MNKNQKIETFIIVFLAIIIAMVIGHFSIGWNIDIVYSIMLALIITATISYISKSKHKKILVMLLTLSIFTNLTLKGVKWYHDTILYPEYPGEDIRHAYTLRFEYAKEEDGSYIYMSPKYENYFLPFKYRIDNLVYEPTSIKFEGEWIYRIITNEGQSNEVVMLIGEKSTLINGVNYLFPSTDEMTSEELQKRFIEEQLFYWYHNDNLNQFRTTEPPIE